MRLFENIAQDNNEVLFCIAKLQVIPKDGIIE